MGYDVTNNDSVIELVNNQDTPNQGNLDTITLPDSTPTSELVGQEGVKPAEDIVVLPDTLPTPELVSTEGATQQEQVVEIPDKIPSEGVVLLEGTEIPISERVQVTVKGDRHYIHTQTVPSLVWNIWHYLKKRPSIHIEDSEGNQVYAEIKHISIDRAQIIFGVEFSGYAYCN